MEMATFFPQSEMRLMDIHGVGAAKQKTYGPLFLDMIRDYCRPLGILEVTKGARKRPSPVSGSIGGKRHVTVGELYNSGETVASLMERFSVKRDTILHHLYTCVQEGYDLIETDEFLALSSLPPGMRHRCWTGLTNSAVSVFGRY